MAMYIFVPLFREEKFCGVSSVFDKLGCAARGKRLRNTGLKLLLYNKENSLISLFMSPCLST
jgi:hypothetical protein